MLPRLPSSMHAGATTPADAARCTCRFSSRTTDGLPLIQGGSASALPVSRPAQRSLHVPACMVAELLNATLLSGVLQSMSLPPRTAPAATSRKRQLLGGIRTHQENALSTAHVESGAGAPTVGSGGISVAFAPVLSPAPMVAFPAPAPRTRRADFRHRALQWDHAPRTQATKANDSKDEVAARVSAAEAARLPPFLPRRARRPSSLSTP